MRGADLAALALGALRGQRLRSLLTALGIAVGIAAVVLLTSLGEGLHRFVLAEFTQFGTNLIGITPGKTNTLGVSGAVISNVRPLSLDDARALSRVHGVLETTPVVQGNAAVEGGDRSRRTTVIGTGPEATRVWQMRPITGRFLPPDDPRAARPLAVLGSTLARELFGTANPLGRAVRIGGERYRVVGVMEPKGQMLGFDLDDTVFIPAARALSMFDRQSLMEIDVLYAPGASAEAVSGALRRVLSARHGAEDFTIVTQEQMLAVLGSVLGVLTVAVGALGSISLLVGGVGILTIMTIAVTERTAEIGLLRAIGARRRQVLALFVGEAVALSAVGGLAGLAAGAGGAWLLQLLVPALPVHTRWGYALAAEGLAALIGLAAGVGPARRAANLDPVEALRAE
jgi:putative ABC transport system permease protein